MDDPAYIIQEASGGNNICQLTHRPLTPGQALGIWEARGNMLGPDLVTES